MQVLWTALGVLVSWLIFIPLQYHFRAKNQRLPAQFFKAMPTFSLAVYVLSCYFLSHSGDVYTLLVGIALVLAALGDALLNIKLAVGGTLFFLCHVCDCIAYSRLQPIRWWMILLALALYAVILLAAGKSIQRVNKHPALRFCLYGYALTLAFMLSITLPLPFMVQSPKAIWAGIGGLCFVASDGWLLLNTVRKRKGWYRLCALLLYYAAQAMIAFSAISR